jgi:hypothetical protein
VGDLRTPGRSVYRPIIDAGSTRNRLMRTPTISDVAAAGIDDVSLGGRVRDSQPRQLPLDPPLTSQDVRRGHACHHRLPLVSQLGSS